RDADSARYDVESVKRRLREKRAALRETQNELLSAEAQVRDSSSQRGKPSDFQARFGPAVQAADPELPRRLKEKADRLLQEIGTLERDLGEANRRLDEKRANTKEAVEKGLERIAIDTKLGFLFAYKTPAEVVEVLAASSVQWERLDQNDVDTLITLAEFLSQ